MRSFKIKEYTPTESRQVTRIEIRHNGKSKSLTLDPTNAIDLSEYLQEKLSEVNKSVTLRKFPITESPVRHIDKCMVQVYEATTRSMSKKDNFRSFTCYGIKADQLSKLIHQFITES